MTWAIRLELDQTPHCLLSTLSEIVNYYPTTLESEMDPAFWQYCEIPLDIYGFSLNNNNNNKNKRKKVNKRKYHRRIFIYTSYQICNTTLQERIFVILFFRSSFVLNFNYQVNIFASCRTRVFAAALWSNFNAMVEKKIALKLRKYARERS